jgi:hypothetical protein
MKGPGLSDPSRSPHAHAEQLLELAAADDNTFTNALVRYLVNPTPEGSALYRSDVLCRRTRLTVGQLLQLADKHDRKGNPDLVRSQWKAIRQGARAEREALTRLPPEGAGPRRRALERLGQEFPDEATEIRHSLRRIKHRDRSRQVLEELSRRHSKRFSELRHAERKAEASD